MPVLLVAGPKDHGAVGRHEYEKDLRELAEVFGGHDQIHAIEKRGVAIKA